MSHFKLQAITELRSPRNVTKVRCLLGMVNQMKHFPPDLICNTWHICQLLKGAVFEWNEEMEKELQTLKEIVNSPFWRKQFDVNKKTRLYTYTSKLYGCAYLLTQITREVNARGEEIQHLMKCNSVVAKPEWWGYSPLEVELLAVLWACQETEYYIRGSPSVEFRTDHKPL